LKSNTKSYGGTAHYTESQNSDTSAPSGRELYHLQFSLQVANLETFGYTLVETHCAMTFTLSADYFSSTSLNIHHIEKLFK
jgi:hypothetical protein